MSTLSSATVDTAYDLRAHKSAALHDHDASRVLNPLPFIQFIWDLLYLLVQKIIISLFKPRPPLPAGPTKPYGRIAVIGAGLTGVSSAAHAIAHNFDVVIYEAAPRSGLGGIWSHVNATSGLQLNSLLYRFHPAVLWRRAFPRRDEIVGEITKVWEEYRLEPRTRFETKVTSVRRLESEPEPDHEPVNEHDPDAGEAAKTSQWLINDGADGPFDAVIVTIGTCGDPKWLKLDGMPPRDEDSEHTEGDGAHTDGDADVDDAKHIDHDVFRGPILHSSQLDTADKDVLVGKTVVVIGSGASGVEAVETALARGAAKTVMVARSDKWIIPRNIFIDTVLAMQPFGREMPLSFLWEGFLKRWHYRGNEDLVPADLGLFEGTPVVNDEFLVHVRSGRCEYARGDPLRLTANGVRINARARGTKPGADGEAREIAADVVVLATGFSKPDIKFLPGDLFPPGYERPNLYLQNFATGDWSVLLTNSAYMSGIGTVGHFHIGIYTRILLTLLRDASARPAPGDMRLWVDVVRFVKRGARGGALGFFTYAELTLWLVSFHLFRPDRLRWFFFILLGWGGR